MHILKKTKWRSDFPVLELCSCLFSPKSRCWNMQCYSGTEAPCAYGELISIGAIGGDKNKKVSTAGIQYDCTRTQQGQQALHVKQQLLPLSFPAAL
jgi:hypothetical protein